MLPIFPQRTRNSWATRFVNPNAMTTTLNISRHTVRAAVDCGRSEGIKQAYSMGLSNFSQRIFRKMGFTERDSIEFKDYTQADIGAGCIWDKHVTTLSIFMQDGNSVFDLAKMGDHASGILFTANIE